VNYVYDAVISFITEFFNVDFLSQLIATLIGVLIGFGGAFYLNSRNSNESVKIRKENTIKAIHEELRTVQKAIEDLVDKGEIKWIQKDLEFQGAWISISTPAFQSSVNSGDFSLLDTKLQTEIGMVYLAIDELQMFTQQRMQYPFTVVMQSTEAEKEANNIVQHTNQIVSRLHNELVVLLPKLNK